MRVKVGEFDVQLLRLLSKNARLNYSQLAEALNTTRQRIARRMERLERMGVIKKYTLIPDFDRLGYARVMLGITLKPGVRVEPVIERLREEKDVKVIERGIGVYNIIVHLVVPKDVKEIERRIRELSTRIEGIDKIDITFITDTVKFEIL